ncbi:tyrosine-type recombinase/integrase [Vibrio lentus]|uniref:tyrosine-type recombinase/integrase n=1 Tax=Vibrio lentus TaxID=136468 RepID=UPI0040632566
MKIGDNNHAVLAMRNFISECEEQPVLLWDVELSMSGVHKTKLAQKDPDLYFEDFGFASTKYLADKLQCNRRTLNTDLELLSLRKQLNRLLIEHKVSLPYSEIKDSGHSIGFDLNNRRLFLKWKNSLQHEEILRLPLFGEVIAQKAFSHIIPTKQGASKHQLLRHEYLKFSEEVIELKGLDYKTVTEREKIRNKNALESNESKISLFYNLRDKKLVSVEDFSSEKGYYEDVRHAFAAGSLKAISESGIKNYLSAFEHYCDFLLSKNIPITSSYKECFSAWSLRDFKEFLGEKIGNASLSTSFATTILSALRMTLNNLKAVRRYDFSYYPADGFELTKNSIAYKSYSVKERQRVHNMLEQEMTFIRRKLEPYKKLDRNSVDLNDPKVQARIIFEDDCNCEPTYVGSWATSERSNGQNKLVNFALTRRLSLPELYDEWGVLTRKVTVRELGVYVLKMAQVLGMNLSPILALELDDYQAHHPLTNKPCLTYWKERSTGEKMLHLDLFDADLQWLTISQKNFVESVFHDVIRLTSEARKFAPSSLSNVLFINLDKSVQVISDVSMSRLYSELVQEYRLESDDGEPLVLTTTRFRPTLVSELIDKGISLREIQYLLGHASIYTTIKYIEELDFERIIRDKARQAIEELYSTAVTKSEGDRSKKRQRRYDEELIIMKTPLSGCKNIFDPPDFIRKLSHYVKGTPCSQYNKCLGCENVMLTEKHLPDLFAMQRDYLASVENSAIVDTPYYAVVSENLSLLDDILNPETSEFEENILSQAREDSLFIETTILDSWG